MYGYHAIIVEKAYKCREVATKNDTYLYVISNEYNNLLNTLNKLNGELINNENDIKLKKYIKMTEDTLSIVKQKLIYVVNELSNYNEYKNIYDCWNLETNEFEIKKVINKDYDCITNISTYYNSIISNEILYNLINAYFDNEFNLEQLILLVNSENDIY